jgi:hypothetical protein
MGYTADPLTNGSVELTTNKWISGYVENDHWVYMYIKLNIFIFSLRIIPLIRCIFLLEFSRGHTCNK